jgi:hypothetical protein
MAQASAWHVLGGGSASDQGMIEDAGIRTQSAGRSIANTAVAARRHEDRARALDALARRRDTKPG